MAGLRSSRLSAPRVVRITSHVVALVSRNEARRFADRLQTLRVVILDFDGGGLIGPSFADELVRVWAREHPDIELRVSRASRNMWFVVDRALRNR